MPETSSNAASTTRSGAVLDSRQILWLLVKNLSTLSQVCRRETLGSTPGLGAGDLSMNGVSDTLLKNGNIHKAIVIIGDSKRICTSDQWRQRKIGGLRRDLAVGDNFAPLS
jgi:hypothetical protein